MKRTMLFVYGSMRHGEPNIWRMHEIDAEARGRAILPGHQLHTAQRVRDGRWIAYAVPTLGHVVVGDLFAIPVTSLSWIDGFEGHPYFYRREVVTVELVKPGAPAIRALAYVMPLDVLPENALPCRQPDWLACRGGRV